MDQAAVIQRAVAKVGGVVGDALELVDGVALSAAVAHLRRRIYEARIRRVTWSAEDVEAARLVVMGLAALADEVGK